METLNNFLIYALQSPKKRHNLYVGQTDNWDRRMKRHQKEDSNCIAIARAIKKYKWENIKRIVLIEGLTKEQANYWEKHYIAIFDSFHNGYNLTTGGGSYEVSQISRDRMVASQNRPEVKAKKSARAHKNWQDPEFRANHSAAMNKPEFKAKKSEVMKALHASPEFKAKHKASVNTPEVKAKQSEATTKLWEDPVYRADKSAVMLGNTYAAGYKHTDQYKAEKALAWAGDNNPAKRWEVKVLQSLTKQRYWYEKRLEKAGLLD